MKRNLITDLSALSLIRMSILDKLIELSELCICDYIIESKIKDTDFIEINIGIGKLSILRSDESIEYRFIPSNKLEKLIIANIDSNKSLLTEKSEVGLENKLLTTYKELF